MPVFQRHSPALTTTTRIPSRNVARHIDHGDDREHQEFDGKPEDIALAYRSVAFGKTREVAGIKQQGRKLGDDQHGSVGHHADRGGDGCGWRAELQREAGKPGLATHPSSRRKHHDINNRAAEIDKFTDRLHAAQDYDQSEEPYEKEAEPDQRRQAGDAVVGQIDGRRDQRADVHARSLGHRWEDHSLAGIPDGISAFLPKTCRDSCNGGRPVRTGVCGSNCAAFRRADGAPDIAVTGESK